MRKPYLDSVRDRIMDYYNVISNLFHAMNSDGFATDGVYSIHKDDIATILYHGLTTLTVIYHDNEIESFVNSEVNRDCYNLIATFEMFILTGGAA